MGLVIPLSEICVSLFLLFLIPAVSNSSCLVSLYANFSLFSGHCAFENLFVGVPWGLEWIDSPPEALYLFLLSTMEYYLSGSHLNPK